MPPEKFLLTYIRKKRLGKRGEKKENCKREGGNLEMEVVKVVKRGDDFFFFFFFFFLLFTFENNRIFFCLPKWGIFYREKAFHAGKKIRKNDFAPTEIYACYAPGHHQSFPYIHCVFIEVDLKR